MDLFTLAPLALFLLPITWLFVKVNKMEAQLDKVYTKEETEKLIDLKQKPVIDALNRNTDATTDLAKAVNDLRVDLAKIAKD